MTERLLLGDLASLLNRGAPSSEWSVEYLDGRLGIVPEETHLQLADPDVYACLNKYRPMKSKIFQTRGQYDPTRMNRTVENLWILDNDQENCLKTPRQIKNLERYLRDDIFPRILEHAEWVLDETMWPISRECFDMLCEMVSCHPDCDTEQWRAIELYFQDLDNMNDYCESFFEKEEDNVMTVKCY